MEKLTDREREVYEFILQFKKRDGYSPSVREIQKGLDIKSTATVYTIINRLVDKGCLTRTKGLSRSITSSENVEFENSKVVTVPILGKVAAGSPVFATENYDNYIDFPTRSRNDLQSELFALRVSGESMIEDGILDGDIVIVRKRNVAENGEIVVALLEDSATVKRFYKEEGRFRLQPANSSMSPIYTNELIILGKVISVIRYYNR